MRADAAYRALDAGTRAFWRLAGRRVDLGGEHAWLRAPAADSGTIGESWLDAAAASVGGTVARGQAGGLVPDVSALDGPGFAAPSLAPAVRHFYEHTDAWTMDAWSSWSPVFQPGGLLVEHLFGRRLQQLALPVQPLDVSHGIDSEIVAIRDADGEQVWAAWLRRLRRSGQFLFSGAYAVRSLPGAERPGVHVTFPLESGNVQVFLRPEVRDDGALILASTSSAFGGHRCLRPRPRPPPRRRGCLGDEGADPRGVRRLRRRPGDLRTDHELKAGPARALRLHDRMRRGKVDRTASRLVS